MATETHQFLVGTPITSHSFNKARSEVAIIPDSNELHIYAKEAGKWTQTQTLAEHDKLITCVDWAPKTNRIVTCSQDRNAYVWNLVNGAWVPTLVLLRINRSATHVRWSPKEDKFAVASGARLISVCYFEEEHNWWVSKHLKKPIRSTVLSVDWHPENIILAAGCSDMTARVFSGWIKGIDSKASNPVWGEKLPFGTLCAEYPTNGWVHSVSFSPSGNQVAFCSHDSSVTIASGSQIIQSIKTTLLPFVSLSWASETAIFAAGHDCAPYVIYQNQNKWQISGNIDSGKKKETGTSAMDKFKKMDSLGQTDGTSINTTHQSTITCVRPYKGESGRVSQFSTTGVDGQLAVWDILNAGIANLKI